MNLLLLFSLLLVISPKTTRRNRNRQKSRRKNRKQYKQLGLTAAEQNEITRKHQLLTSIIKSDLHFQEDEPFAATTYFDCSSPPLQCSENESCKQVNKIKCRRGACTTVPEKFCESTCDYDCEEHPEHLLSDIIAEEKLGSTTSTTMTTTTTTTPTSTSSTAKPTLKTIPASTTVETARPITSPVTNITQPYLTIPLNGTDQTAHQSISVSDRNCIFFPNRGGFQCKNWKTDSIGRDLRKARSRIDNNLKSYVSSNLPKFDLPFDPDWRKIYHRHVTIYTDEILTTKLFSRCLNFHFVAFNQKMPMPPRKLEVESIIQMVKIRSVCGIPLTPLRKQLLLDAMWYFTRHCRRNKNIGLSQYILRLVEDEQTVSPSIEETFVSRAIAKILNQSARKWARTDIFDALKVSTDIPQFKLAKMNKVLTDAIDAALKSTAGNDLRHIILDVMRNANEKMKLR